MAKARVQSLGFGHQTGPSFSAASNRGTMKIILPFKNLLQACLSIGPSQGLIYTLTKEFIPKMPFQYDITHKVVAQLPHYLTLSLWSFVAMEKETAEHDALQSRPHINPPSGRLAAHNGDG